MKVELQETRRSTATAYHFRGANGDGWAICTVNDATGELLIQSDWTDACGYRWHVDHLGCPTLTEFLARDRGGHYDYLVGKLLPPERRRQFSPEATIAEMRRRVTSARRDGELTRGAARDIWGDIGEFASHDNHSADLFFLNVPDSYSEHFADVHEDYRDELTRDALALEGFILPALVEACGREMERRRLAAANGPIAATDGARA